VKQQIKQSLETKYNYRFNVPDKREVRECLVKPLGIYLGKNPSNVSKRQIRHFEQTSTKNSQSPFGEEYRQSRKQWNSMARQPLRSTLLDTVDEEDIHGRK
jgi:hypothetical protein